MVTLVSDVPRARRAHYVGIDNSAAGRTAASLLGRFLAGRTGKVGLIAGSIALRDHIERQLGFEQVITPRLSRRCSSCRSARAATTTPASRNWRRRCSPSIPTSSASTMSAPATAASSPRSKRAGRDARRRLHRPRADAVLAPPPDPRHDRRHHQPGSRARGAERHAPAHGRARGHPDLSRPGAHPHRHFHARQRSVAARGRRGGAVMYLGIDIGTSSVKAVLIDDAPADRRQRDRAARGLASAFRLVGAGSGELVDGVRGACSTGWPGRTARRWPRSRASACPATCTARRCSTRPTSRSAPASSGTTGARPTEAAELDRNPIFRTITGNIVFPGFTAPKLVWVARHEPEIFAKVAKVLLPKDYVRLKLTGDHASRHVGLRRHVVARRRQARDWCDELLAATELSPRRRCRSSIEGIARRPASCAPSSPRAGAWPASAVVAGGGGDNAASACGVGVVSAGHGFVSLGTSGVLFVSNARFSPDPASAVHAFCHAVPDTWHQMGVILSAAGALEWLAERLRRRRRPTSTPPLGEPTAAGPATVMFLPYLGGERTPHNDAAVRGSFVGLEPRHRPDRADPGRAGRRRLRLRRLPRRAPPGRRRRRAARSPSAAARARATGCGSSPTRLDIADRRARGRRFRRRPSAPRGSA